MSELKFRVDPNPTGVVAMFPNKAPEDEQDGGVDSIEFSLHQHNLKGGRQILTGHNHVMEWQGVHRPNKRNWSQYCIGVYNSETQQVKLMRISTIFEMRNNLRGGFDSEVKEAKQGVVVPFFDNSGLVEAFGPSRAKRFMRARVVNKLDSNAVSKADRVSHQIVKSAQNNQDVLNTVTERNLPPHSLTAQHPSMIYPFNNLIPEDLHAALAPKDIVKASRKHSVPKEWAASGIAQFVVEGLAVVVAAEPDKKAKKQKAVMLASISNLFRLHAIRTARMKTVTELRAKLTAKVPESFVNFLFRTFYGPSGRIEPLSEDLLVEYIMVIALHLHNYVLNIKTILKDLGLTANKGRAFFKELGCSITTGFSRIPTTATKEEREEDSVLKKGQLSYHRTFAQLKAPLTFPGVVRHRR